MCESAEDWLLVVATCAWGLRRGEVARLSRDQFAPTDGDNFEFLADPHIVFDEERKNGPGRVSIIYGLETLADRWANLEADGDWDGYLFPSTAASSGHVNSNTISARFKRLVTDAGITVRDETPTPQYGRRFWYRTYADNSCERVWTTHLERYKRSNRSSDPVFVTNCAHSFRGLYSCRCPT